MRSFPKILIQALIEDFPEGGPIHQKYAPPNVPRASNSISMFTRNQRNAILVKFKFKDLVYQNYFYNPWRKKSPYDLSWFYSKT